MLSQASKRLLLYRCIGGKFLENDAVCRSFSTGEKRDSLYDKMMRAVLSGKEGKAVKEDGDTQSRFELKEVAPGKKNTIQVESGRPAKIGSEERIKVEKSRRKFSSSKEENQRHSKYQSKEEKEQLDALNMQESSVDLEAALEGISQPSSVPRGRQQRKDTKSSGHGGVRVSDLSEDLDALQEDLDKESSIPRGPKKINFAKKRGEEPRQQIKDMKPGQINIKLVEAAKAVAAESHGDKSVVLDDILGKLDDVFVGMDRHHKGKKQSQKLDLKKQAFPKVDLPSEELDLFKGSENAGGGSPEVAYVDLALNEDKQFVERKRVRSFKTTADLIASETPLNIFDVTQKFTSEPSLKMWSSFEHKELLRITRFEPLNWYDQCIVWTEEGKLWQFPINNEQGMDEEAKVDFTEHLFLDHHIESWCPQEGPIRYFMELVLVGLSKNPFITVKEKVEILEWYHKYFMQHQSLLEEINAFGSVQNPIPVEGQVN